MRGLYAKRKRPILLGLAAVAVALGTIQVAKLAAPNPDDMAAPAASVDGDAVAGAGRRRTASIPADPTLPPAPRKHRGTEAAIGIVRAGGQGSRA